MSKTVIKPLGEILQFQRGYDLPSTKRTDGSYPIISSGGFSGTHSSYKVDGENVVTGRYGTIGEIYYYNGKCWPLNTALYVKDFKGNIPKYIYYLLQYSLKVDGKDKSTVPGVDRNVLHTLSTPYFCDLDYQKAVIKPLVAIDDKIALNKRINTDLEAMARTLYDYWFVQFDFPDKNGKPYKSNGGKMVWNNEQKREIPEGWQVKPALEIFDWIGTSQPPKSVFSYELKDGYIRFIQNRDYDDDSHLTYIPLTNTTRTCDEYDIMIDKYGDAGKTRFGIAGAYNVALSKIVVHNEEMKEYIRAYLSSPSVYEYLHSACIASTRASLNEDNFAFLSVVVPEEYVINKYKSVMKPQIKKILQLKSENACLASLRNHILPLLMKDQVKVKE